MVLARPLGGQVDKAGHSHAVRQPPLDRGFHEVGREKRERDGHVDLSRAASLPLRDCLGCRRSIRHEFVEPRTSAGNRRYEGRPGFRPYRTSAASRAITGYENFSVSLQCTLTPRYAKREI